MKSALPQAHQPGFAVDTCLNVSYSRKSYNMLQVQVLGSSSSVHPPRPSSCRLPQREHLESIHLHAEFGSLSYGRREPKEKQSKLHDG
eukprot:1366692-Amphidinium_carterae.1